VAEPGSVCAKRGLGGPRMSHSLLGLIIGGSVTESSRAKRGITGCFRTLLQNVYQGLETG
jgi:hypothetical protein